MVIGPGTLVVSPLEVPVSSTWPETAFRARHFALLTQSQESSLGPCFYWGFLAEQLPLQATALHLVKRLLKSSICLVAVGPCHTVPATAHGGLAPGWWQSSGVLTQGPCPTPSLLSHPHVTRWLLYPDPMELTLLQACHLGWGHLSGRNEDADPRHRPQGPWQLPQPELLPLPERLQAILLE